MNLPKHLSVSKINMFEECPFKWLCSYKKYPMISRRDLALRFGLEVHNIIKIYYSKIEDFPSVKEINDFIEEAKVEGGGYATDQKKLVTKRLFKRFEEIEQERVKYRIHKPILIEKRLDIRLFNDLPVFIIKPDAYLEDQKTIWDWKSGKNGDITEGMLLQGKSYELGIKKEGYEVEKVIFHNLNVGVSPTMPRVSDGLLYGKAKRMCDMIEHDRFPSLENSFCGYCEYKLRCDLRNKCVWWNA